MNKMKKLFFLFLSIVLLAPLNVNAECSKKVTDNGFIDETLEVVVRVYIILGMTNSSLLIPIITTVTAELFFPLFFHLNEVCAKEI